MGLRIMERGGGGRGEGLQSIFWVKNPMQDGTGGKGWKKHEEVERVWGNATRVARGRFGRQMWGRANGRKAKEGGGGAAGDGEREWKGGRCEVDVRGARWACEGLGGRARDEGRGEAKGRRLLQGVGDVVVVGDRAQPKRQLAVLQTLSAQRLGKQNAHEMVWGRAVEIFAPLPGGAG